MMTKFNLISSFALSLTLTVISSATPNNPPNIPNDQFGYPQHAQAFGITFDSKDNIYVSGMGVIDPTDNFADSNQWIVRKSSDNGQNWNTVDTYTLSKDRYALAYTMVADRNNSIFAAGFASEESRLSHGMIKKTENEGLTWKVVSDAGSSSTLKAVAMNSDGHFFAVGWGPFPNWYTQKSTDGGSTWVKMGESVTPSIGGWIVSADAITTDMKGHIFVGVHSMDFRANVQRWIVLKSTDQGNSWYVSDNYSYHPSLLSRNSDAFPTSMTTDLFGNLYVSGTAYDHNGIAHWIVRKSPDSGVTWKTIEDFWLQFSREMQPTGVAIDPLGSIYVAGMAASYGSFPSSWLVRKSTDGGTTWETISKFDYGSENTTRARNIAINSKGDIYVIGGGFDKSGVMHWLVRKSGDAGETWTMVDDFTPVNFSGFGSCPQSASLQIPHALCQ